MYVYIENQESEMPTSRLEVSTVGICEVYVCMYVYECIEERREEEREDRQQYTHSHTLKTFP